MRLSDYFTITKEEYNEKEKTFEYTIEVNKWHLLFWFEVLKCLPKNEVISRLVGLILLLLFLPFIPAWIKFLVASAALGWVWQSCVNGLWKIIKKIFGKREKVIEEEVRI